MRRTTILNAKVLKRTSFKEAETAFYKHCKLRNLTEQTLRYYTEDLTYFHANVPVRYADEITKEVFDDFIFQELEAGKKVSSLNSRIRGMRVFFKFCAGQDYMKPIVSMALMVMLDFFMMDSFLALLALAVGRSPYFLFSWGFVFLTLYGLIIAKGMSNTTGHT